MGAILLGLTTLVPAPPAKGHLALDPYATSSAPPPAGQPTVDALAPDPAAVVATALADCGSSLSVEEGRRIAATIVDESARHGYDPLFVQAIVEVESTCRPTARSPAGAVGLIQLIPSTARDVARRAGIRWHGVEGLLRPEVSLELGLRYLAELEDRFADPYLAVAAFNLGPGRVAAMHPGRARQSHYVRKVLSRYEGLLEEHASTPS
jgi:soluble lytic murein transglycosylase-like protein